jgi:GT2 family glycosyltransferase
MESCPDISSHGRTVPILVTQSKTGIIGQINLGISECAASNQNQSPHNAALRYVRHRRQLFIFSEEALSETVYILLPVHNRCDVTKRFIDCLKVQTYTNFHLVLIDDGSTDGTAGMVREHIAAVTVIKGNGNWWWAGSLQQGYLWLKKQNIPQNSIVLIINDDTIFEPDFIEKAVMLLADEKGMLLSAYYFSLQDGRLIDSGLHIDWKLFTCIQTNNPDEINCLSTRGLFLRCSDLMEIGGFYPKILPHYYSDYEFTIRAFRKGFKLFSDAKLQLWGDESTTGLHSMKPETTWHTLKNLFSIKTIPNPVVESAYILLACPYPWIVINLLRVWNNSLSTLKVAFLNDFRRICSFNLKV